VAAAAVVSGVVSVPFGVVPFVGEPDAVVVGSSVDVVGDTDDELVVEGSVGLSGPPASARNWTSRIDSGNV